MGTRIAATAAWTAAAGLVLTVAACGSSRAGATAASSTTAYSDGTGSSLQQEYENVVTQALPSVVQIFTNDSTGSGVVYDSKGDIVTNAHVVGTASTVRVGWPGAGTLRRKGVRVFAARDLAA